MLPKSGAPQRQPWDLVPSSQAKWAKFGGLRQPCHECIQMLHGGARTAAPDSARLKRTVGEKVSLLCTTHGQARREADDDAKAQAKFAASQGRLR